MMKTTTYAVLALGALAVAACATSLGPPVDEQQLGLSKTSVYDAPVPATFSYPAVEPDEAERLPRAFLGAPPQVPHEVETLPPITAEKNECLDCHNKPHLIGKGKKGISPMPESHYVKVEGRPRPWGARYVCNQCHVPQAEVKPLVRNTFTGGEFVEKPKAETAR